MHVTSWLPNYVLYPNSRDAIASGWSQTIFLSATIQMHWHNCGLYAMAYKDFKGFKTVTKVFQEYAVHLKYSFYKTTCYRLCNFHILFYAEKNEYEFHVNVKKICRNTQCVTESKVHKRFQQGLQRWDNIFPIINYFFSLDTDFNLQDWENVKYNNLKFKLPKTDKLTGFRRQAELYLKHGILK